MNSETVVLFTGRINAHATPSKAAIRYLNHTFIVEKLYHKRAGICYNRSMSKKILIVGKNLASTRDFAEAFSLGDCSVAVADDSSKNIPASSSINVVLWTKGSSVSARSLIIQTETTIGSVDDYILFFDSHLYASEYSSFSADNCQKSCDEMIAAFQYFAIEAINRMEKRNVPARLVFVLKTHPSMKDFIQMPSVKNMVSIPANPFVAAGEAAFANFAENIAAMESEKENVSVLLVTGDSQNETMQNNSSLASWLSDYINALDNQKNKTKGKNSVSWVKAGAKMPGSFPFFR